MYQDTADCQSSRASSNTPAAFRKSCLVISHKRFYFVNGQYCSEGGFGKYVEVIRSLFDRVYLAVPVEHGPPKGDVGPLRDGVAEVIELPGSYARHRFSILGLLHPWRLVRPLARAAKRADVVHVIFPGYVQIVGLAVARWLRRPHFCSIVGDWEADYAVSSFARSHALLVRPVIWVHRLLVRWVLQSKLVFVHGATMAERYRRRGRCIVVNQSSTFREADIRNSNEVSTLRHMPRLLFVGRLDYKKGVPTLLDALKKLHEKHLPATLTIVGGGPDRKSFEKQASRLGLQEAVTFEGYVKDHQRLREIYRAHDLFVLPSLTEGAPKVVIEAYAQGLPVVASNAGGIPDMVSEKNGILVEPGDPDALAEAIQRILHDDTYRLNLARHNLQEAHRYTMEAQVQHMTRHLRKCMAESV